MVEVRLGVAGTGFIGTHFVMSLESHDGYTSSRILTRRNPKTIRGFPENVITNSIDDLVAHSDVIVECSGDPVWATEVISAAVERGLPVVTMNTEFHITCGSAFVGKGLVTEAEGDQPGCLAALHEEAVAMGFEPVAYGNLKGFLNPDPTPEEMEYWGKKQGISLPMVTSFTDGTKVQAEQILVANHFGATIAKEGMMGASVQSIDEGARLLAAEAERVDQRISDFVVGPGLPHGVFVVATHDQRQALALEYFKLGPGPYYTLIRNNIFVHLEILKTVRRVLEDGKPLLDNSGSPSLSLAAVAKRDLERGHRLTSALGSFDLRGYAVRISDYGDHVPLGLLQGSTVARDLHQGEIVTWDHVEVPSTQASDGWNRTLQAVTRVSG